MHGLETLHALNEKRAEQAKDTPEARRRRLALDLSRRICRAYGQGQPPTPEDRAAALELAREYGV